MNITTYDYIDSNKRKTVLLIFLFPLSLLFLFVIVLYLIISVFPELRVNNLPIFQQIFEQYWGFLLLSIGFSVLWTAIAFLEGSNIVLKMADAEEADIQNPVYKDIKRILENVSITAGIPTPALYILSLEPGLNAFAVGTNKNNSAVVLTKGLIETLDSSEIEAVIAHEVAHIVHQDTKLMMAITLLIGFFTLVGGFLLRSNNGRGRIKTSAKAGRGGVILIIIGLVLYVYGTIVAPLIRLAISRTREYKADAKSALLTRNPQALISALRKISNRPIVSRFEDNELMSPMCIVSPLTIKVSLFDTLSNLSSTHPPIEKRIEALQVMDGQNGNL